MADDTNIPTGIEASDASKIDAPSAQAGRIPHQVPDAQPNNLANEPATPTLAGSFVMPTQGLDSFAAPQSVPVPIAPAAEPGSQKAPSAAIPEDETDYERTERLKVNTDDALHSGVISDDIAKILKEVKLPERRGFKGAADTRAIPVTAPDADPASTTEADAQATPPKKRDIVTALHTLKDDVQDVVRTRNMSMVRASALEQDKKRGALARAASNPGAAQRRLRTFGFIFFSLLLFAFGAAALYGVAVVTGGRAATTTVQYPSLIFAESTMTLPIDNTTPQSLKAVIAQARAQSDAPLGSITRIIPTVAATTTAGTQAPVPATLQQFFTALGLSVPSELMQGLGSTFFFGIHTVDINAPLFVIPVTSYDLAFAGMLAWEPTMDQDLAPAFDAVPALTTGPGGLPTARTFTDAVMLNYDIRELKDDAGNVVLYYSFPTPNLLVIAESPASFSEILSRLEAQREL